MLLRRKKKLCRFLGHGALHVFFIALCFATLVPILYALSVSLNAENSLLSSEFRFIPRQFTWANYRAVFTERAVMLWFKNSMILAVCTVVISLGAAIPAAYVFSRKRFAGRGAVLEILLLLYSFPSVLSMFAIYKLLSPLGLVNSRIGLILVYTGTMAVFGLWNMKGYFDTIPVEIEEAAAMDGATNVQLVTKIVLPLAKPSIIVTAVMILIYVWNEYLFAITFMTGAEHYTLAAGLYSLQATEISGSWPVFAAAALVVSAPILVIFFAVQRHMTSGLTAGGVKG
ncbi:sugar ABC transporter permease [Allofournierella sp.]|uniref:sugar ABC transporter permease n=1 Tax=Allofournierella sp. TaxID=1940256 RepID=UPI003AB57B3B